MLILLSVYNHTDIWIVHGAEKKKTVFGRVVKSHYFFAQLHNMISSYT